MSSTRRPARVGSKEREPARQGGCTCRRGGKIGLVFPGAGLGFAPDQALVRTVLGQCPTELATEFGTGRDLEQGILHAAEVTGILPDLPDVEGGAMLFVAILFVCRGYHHAVGEHTFVLHRVLRDWEIAAEGAGHQEQDHKKLCHGRDLHHVHPVGGQPLQT